MNTISPFNPSTGTAQVSAASGLLSRTGNQEAFFLQMLLAQVKNQDPLNPTDTSQFVSQLTQFSQLEQLISIRASMETLTAAKAAPPAGNTAPTLTQKDTRND